MKTFEELYQEVMEQELKNGRKLAEEYDNYSMDCLLHPKKYAPVIPAGNCDACETEGDCQNSCIFDAIEKIQGKIYIDPQKCTGCGVCVDVCKMGHLMENREIYPVMEALCDHEKEVYAMIAPAFAGQYGEQATAGRLRAAFKKIGFTGMVEVAAFADILTLKEALEFDRHVVRQGDFQLTSCCCPVWIAMIRDIYQELVGHVPGAVSPMIAAGRIVKKLHPGAVTVFIGPCMAKKKEAREPDIADAVDYVLTYQEVKEFFEAMNIKPEEMEEDEREHSSRAGRIYARTSGVSEAVRLTAEQLNPDKPVKVNAEQADGVLACKALIEKIQKGETTANFFEGMACNGGCVGGPRVMIDKTEGKAQVDQYGDQAAYQTPLENPYVKELLERLGFTDIMDFLDNSDLLTRDFGV
ncbi:MAG: 4Fe-4S binding protein [Lachnospiraceae bacterium]|nr:4Fe-4S binding protein [Lachnospiraceae bacterium]